MDGRDVVITLTHDQALVLSDWLERVESTEAFGRIVDDRAVWSALRRISTTFDKVLPDLFEYDYKERLRAAQERLAEGVDDPDFVSPPEHG